MAGRIKEFQGTGEERREVARFLADFVRRGELSNPRHGDDEEAHWEQRFRWWWDENPMCRPESPLGFLLYAGEQIVGFNGFIPLDYAIDDETVPTLLATTFFVEEKHRDSVLGMLARLRRLGNEYQIIDGSPSEPMREILGKMGFEKEDERYQYFFPLKTLGGQVTQPILHQFGLSLPLGHSLAPGSYLAVTPEEVESFPKIRDGKLRRSLSVESLQWLISVGSEPRSFFGLCDAQGQLQSYAIGVYKERFGLKACMLLDSCDFTPEQNGLENLLSFLTKDPESAGVLSGTDLITWSVLDSGERPKPAGLRRGSILHYSLPRHRSACRRASVPFESDIPLL
jgi:hypothetical protein